MSVTIAPEQTVSRRRIYTHREREKGKGQLRKDGCNFHYLNEPSSDDDNLPEQEEEEEEEDIRVSEDWKSDCAQWI